MSPSERIAVLQATRPRSRLVRATAIGLGVLIVLSWASGEIAVGELFTPRRAANLERFVTIEAVPHPLRGDGLSLAGLWSWAGGVLSDRGLEAMLATLWISVLAIVLAALVAFVTMPLASRSLATCDPYCMGACEKPCRSWGLLVGTVRACYVVMRAIPEYVWVFLLVAMLGPTPWPAVIALAVHNGGILGRLGADTVENLEAAPLRSLRMLGASRTQLATVALLPLALPRLLLYFFYRFETCVREATVLGMLGVVSLGYYIQEARARQFYDEMLLLVALGVVIVLVGDLVSYAARGYVRRA